MNDLHKRFLLFLIFCIGSRTAFAIIANQINVKYLPYLGVLALLPAISWIYLYFSGKRNTGPEVFGEEIWWNQLRIVHALVYILFAVYAIQKKPFAWIVLAIDVLIGLTGFLYYHISVGNM